MGDKIFLEKLGKRVRTIRLSAGLTQQELANMLGTNHTAIVRLEKGGINSSIIALKNISDALGVTIVDLVDVK